MTPLEKANSRLESWKKYIGRPLQEETLKTFESPGMWRVFEAILNSQYETSFSLVSHTGSILDAVLKARPNGEAKDLNSPGHPVSGEAAARRT